MHVVCQVGLLKPLMARALPPTASTQIHRRNSTALQLMYRATLPCIIPSITCVDSHQVDVIMQC